ncbi:hypothetical protein [Agarivorans sp. Alg241-V36]|uniref:hypothetical protein n=1 Tax=Agarivorans sp. Alg241-V36 TaxID=2305992 RepID=UPI0013D1B43C|nr:hypothetical protein [Agarivorans sp. Alg241-V36]
MYQERHSSIRKVISDCALLALIFVLLLSGSFMIINGDTAGKPPEMVKLFISGVFFLGAMLILYGLIYQVRRIRNFRGDWRIELKRDSIRLETPDNEEVEPFEIDPKKIRKLSREAYDDDGIWYKWFIYTEDGGNELKKQFEIGPFSEEKIADEINRFYGIKMVEVDISGEVCDWRYSLWFRLKALLSSVFGILIFLSFVIPGFFYLVKVISH